MRWNPVVAALMSALCTHVAIAGEPELLDEMRYLRERVQLLEEEKGAREAQAADPALTFGALIELEASMVKPHDGGPTESDLLLSTLELSAAARLNEWVKADLVLLYEQKTTEPMEVDQAYITLGNAEASPLFLAAGRMYVPFGRFESGMISDPLTLELAETRESALRTGASLGPLTGSLFVFNGEADDEEALDQFGAQLAYGQESEEGLELGMSWLSSIAESDTLQETIPTGSGKVAGLGLFAAWRHGPWRFIGEHVGATGRFAPEALPFKEGGAQPRAWNLEAGYDFELLDRQMSLALGHQRTHEALALGLPQAVSLATVSVELAEKVALSLEYAASEDYSTDNGGTGENGNALTLQLAAEF